MGINCVLRASQTPEPHALCDDCCETHCAFPGCHSDHLCWDCFMDNDVYRYVTHAEGGKCKTHSKD
jgi:hypothetical protein